MAYRNVSKRTRRRRLRFEHRVRDKSRMLVSWQADREAALSKKLELQLRTLRRYRLTFLGEGLLDEGLCGW